MDSQIELYPHNQIAYDKLRDMLSQSDRACVIQPTGTGKFVIIAKLVQDNPDKRFLLLGTNDYMYIDQMDNLEKIAPGFHPENLQFKTYSAAMVSARSEMVSARSEHVTLQYDYIILDEFHHCGAPEWSKGVQWFIDGNPDAKLLGFSATPIRFSDDGRDMADEIFAGNIASSMELEEASLLIKRIGVFPILILLFGYLAILQFERHPEPLIHRLLHLLTSSSDKPTTSYEDAELVFRPEQSMKQLKFSRDIACVERFRRNTESFGNLRYAIYLGITRTKLIASQRRFAETAKFCQLLLGEVTPLP